MRWPGYMAGIALLVIGCDITPVTSPDYSDPQGRIAFIGGGNTQNFHLFLMRPDGSGIRDILPADDPADYTGYSWSPDGKRLVVSSNRGGNANFDIYVMNTDGTGVQRVVNDSGGDFAPSWSPDGKQIAFQANRSAENGWDIFLVSSDGTGERDLTQNPADEQVPSWSPDGRQIAFQVATGGGSNIWVMDADGSNRRQLTAGGIGIANEGPVWSPDGQKIAFASNMHQNPSQESPGTLAAYEIYSMNADGSDVRRLTSVSDSTRALRWPTWSPDGQRLAAELSEFPAGTPEVHWRIVVFNADGSGFDTLNMAREGRLPRWSP